MLIRGEVNERFPDGFEILSLKGSQEAELLSVESVGGSGALKHVGTLVAGPGRRVDAVQKLTGFPPKHPKLGVLNPAVGYRISPREQTRDRLGYELLVGYEVEAQRLAVREGLLITYRVGPTTYKRFLPARIVFCPPHIDDGRCNEIAETRFPDG